MAAAIEKRTKAMGIPWWVILIQGLASIFLGGVFLSNTVVTLFVIVQLIGLYWLFNGILALVGLLFNRSLLGWKLASGICGILGGILVLSYPILAPVLVVTTLAIILGIDGIIIGVLEIIQALQGQDWATGILGGLSIIIGVLILSNLWKVAFSIPTVLGIVAIIAGILAIVVAFRIKASHDPMQTE